MQVSLNVYDVTNTANDNTNGMITRLNSITRELNLGGVFHGAIQLDDLEWSFGYCESGTGVYCCRARGNSLYTYRENIELGTTEKTKQEIREILSRFKREWPGTSYDLLQRNCCHFCEDFCIALDVPSPPAWLNRFAQGADATVKFTNEASALAKRVGSNISTTAQQSAIWLRELSQRVFSQISLTDSAGASSGDEGGDAGGSGTANPFYARSTSPSASSDPGASRRDGGGMGRLTSRLRPFGANSPGSSGIGSVGGIGLPPSTPSSCCDFSQQSQPCTQAQTFAPRQKWQELEGPTGDSTKQLLFGMIKTLQGRPTEDEESSSFGPTAVGQRPGLPFMNYGSQVPGNTGISPQTASPPAAALTTTGRSLDTCTELNHAPVLQVMQANNVLLHANVEGSTPVTAASPPLTRKAIASPHSVARHVPGGVVEGTSVEVGSRPAAAVAAAPVRHLLDM